MKTLGAFFVAVVITLTVGVPVSLLVTNNAVAAARSTYYAQGVADGKAQVQGKSPANVQTMVDGFCAGTLDLAWFDASMNVTQEQVDAYAAESHECTGSRFLGSLAVTSYSGDQGTSYIFIITMHGKETWWVFTVTSAGLIADLQ